MHVRLGGIAHQLYMKEHKEDGVSSSTMFVGNVDLTIGMTYSDIDVYLRDMLEGFGDIASVSVSAASTKEAVAEGGASHSTQTTTSAQSNGMLDNKSLTTTRTRYAHVVFDKKKSVTNALKAADRGDLDAAAMEVGKRWHSRNTGKNFNKRSRKEISRDFQWRDCGTIDDLKEEVDDYMREFEEGEEKERQERIRKSKEADEDGFMPVRAKKKAKRSTDSNSSRRKGSSSGGSSRSRGEKKSKELTNFYRFQMREEKKESLQSLRAQFEKDKERVAILKQQRAFKPF